AMDVKAIRNRVTRALVAIIISLPQWWFGASLPTRFGASCPLALFLESLWEPDAGVVVVAGTYLRGLGVARALEVGVRSLDLVTAGADEALVEVTAEGEDGLLAAASAAVGERAV